MPLTLLIRIPDQPRFDADTSASWTLLDNANAILRSGEGALATLPRGERVVALAPVGQLLFIETALPPVSPGKRDALLRFAIEDKLTIDPSTVHAVVVGKSAAVATANDSKAAAGTRHVIATIDRSWLLTMLQWLQQAGLPPDSLVSSAAGITVDAGEWVVVFDAERGFAKRADGFVYNLDMGPGGEPPFGLTLALNEARDHQRSPSALVLQSMPSQKNSNGPDAALAAHWEATLGMPVRVATSRTTATTDNLPAVLAASKTANLLTGEFAPREAMSRWMELLKPALTALALIIATHVILVLVDTWRLNGERLALEREMTNTFKSAFPKAQAIVDPPLQMRRNLQQLKRERDIATDTDPQHLVARLAQLIQAVPGAPVAVTALNVSKGAATLGVLLASADQRAALQRAVDQLPGAALANIAGTTADSPSVGLAVQVSLQAGT